jgi:hypothetical protein
MTDMSILDHGKPSSYTRKQKDEKSEVPHAATFFIITFALNVTTSPPPKQQRGHSPIG